MAVVIIADHHVEIFVLISDLGQHLLPEQAAEALEIRSKDGYPLRVVFEKPAEGANRNWDFRKSVCEA